jgi:hypothetical protein
MYPAVPYNFHGLYELHKNEIKWNKEENKKLKQGKTLSTEHYSIMFQLRNRYWGCTRHFTFYFKVLWINRHPDTHGTNVL